MTITKDSIFLNGPKNLNLMTQLWLASSETNPSHSSHPNLGPIHPQTS
jgi:hypothetical protein